MNPIYEIYGTDAHEMTKRLMAEAKVAARIPSGAVIALKPNLINAERAVYCKGGWNSCRWGYFHWTGLPE